MASGGKVSKSRKKTLYVRGQNEPFELSRSKVDLFLQCPKCFYIDRSEKYRISRPDGPMSYIPTAIDLLLKKDFNIYREKQSVHPYCENNGVNLTPFAHPDIELWQNNKKGIRYHDKDTNLILYGAIDDCWIDKETETLFVVDYKSTTASYDPKTLEIKKVNLDEKSAPYKYWYKKQVEFYQWLSQKNNFNVSNKAYFLFCIALYKNVPSFDQKLDFKIDIISYDGDNSWVNNTITSIKKVLEGEDIPDSNPNCKFCNYRNNKI